MSVRTANEFRAQGFLFSELVKRDFKKKYKRTYLGMLWSLISPLLTLLVMSLVFSHLFGNDTPHYTIYLFCGNIVFSYFSDSTGGGMGALLSNADIFSKIRVPKYLFLLSRGVSSLINFGLTLLVFFIFCIADGIDFTPAVLTLPYPTLCLIIYNTALGLTLSVLYVFFRDMQYLWSVFTLLLMYMSAIFYTTDALPPLLRELLYLNPVFVYITYFRTAVIDGEVPSVGVHLLCAGYAALALLVGCLVYKKCNDRMMYYI